MSTGTPFIQTPIEAEQFPVGHAIKIKFPYILRRDDGAETGVCLITPGNDIVDWFPSETEAREHARMNRLLIVSDFDPRYLYGHDAFHGGAAYTSNPESDAEAHNEWASGWLSAQTHGAHGRDPSTLAAFDFIQEQPFVNEGMAAQRAGLRPNACPYDKRAYAAVLWTVGWDIGKWNSCRDDSWSATGGDEDLLPPEYDLPQLTPAEWFDNWEAAQQKDGCDIGRSIVPPSLAA